MNNLVSLLVRLLLFTVLFALCVSEMWKTIFPDKPTENERLAVNILNQEARTQINQQVFLNADKLRNSLGVQSFKDLGFTNDVISDDDFRGVGMLGLLLLENTQLVEQLDRKSIFWPVAYSICKNILFEINNNDKFLAHLQLEPEMAVVEFVGYLSTEVQGFYKYWAKNDGSIERLEEMIRKYEEEREEGYSSKNH